MRPTYGSDGTMNMRATRGNTQMDTTRMKCRRTVYPKPILMKFRQVWLLANPTK